MGQFRIEVTGVGGHGCDRTAKAGEKLYQRCGRFQCPDCMAYDFVQQLRVKGFAVEAATFTHWPGSTTEVVDDLATNSRSKGSF
jgi:hypothetical protein